MEVDYEAAWAEMKAHVLSKRSHGQDQLLAKMARLELDQRVPAGAASLPSHPHGSASRPPRGVRAPGRAHA